ncbi:MAG: hypothetical protein KDK37_01345 [Leptospiraceae bacterium]|nr:hypothetical protein [Leptospiraceae bacterium]MCB1302886.1 hypothetical protein [Leptospiraceae bacterium]
MPKSRLYIIIAVVAVLVVAVIWLLASPGKNEVAEGPDGAPPRESFDRGPSDIEWPDAPAPQMSAEEIRRLWPDLYLPRPDRDEVARQWKEFASRHPDNFYIPNQFKAPLTEEQEKAKRETLDTITSIESRIASSKAQAKNAKPGEEGPDAPSESPIKPEEQRAYFNYRIHEVESRIELIQYFLENGEPDADQKAQAAKDIKNWQEELQEYKDVLEKIPEK